jgi:hypothetical protein
VKQFTEGGREKSFVFDQPETNTGVETNACPDATASSGEVLQCSIEARRRFVTGSATGGSESALK